MLPLVRWIETNNHNSESYLVEADLDYWFALSPIDPIPLRNGIALLQALARDHGPDVGAQIVNQASFAELGFIGGVALGARSHWKHCTDSALQCPLHSSHENFDVAIEGDKCS